MGSIFRNKRMIQGNPTMRLQKSIVQFNYEQSSWIFEIDSFYFNSIVSQELWQKLTFLFWKMLIKSGIM